MSVCITYSAYIALFPGGFNIRIAGLLEILLTQNASNSDCKLQERSSYDLLFFLLPVRDLTGGSRLTVETLKPPFKPTKSTLTYKHRFT